VQEGLLVGGKYRLLRVLGEGSMGSVWAARNEMTERDVALKLILDRNPEYRARMLREARACGRVAHRNVVEVYDVGQTDAGEPFLVMQLLTGEALNQRLRREKPLPAPIAAHVACEIARGLGAAHRAGIVHRDLKPANIFLHEPADADEVIVKVVDFGVSKLTTDEDSSATSTGVVLGSPAYMSPEQARGERNLDARSDLWALGVMLFEMLVGHRPFRGETPYMVVNAVLGDPIPLVQDVAPHLHPTFGEIVTACLERDPRLRLPSTDAFIEKLTPFSSGPHSLQPVKRPGSAAARPVPAPAVSPFRQFTIPLPQRVEQPSPPAPRPQFTQVMPPSTPLVTDAPRPSAPSLVGSNPHQVSSTSGYAVPPAEVDNSHSAVAARTGPFRGPAPEGRKPARLLGLAAGGALLVVGLVILGVVTSLRASKGEPTLPAVTAASSSPPVAATASATAAPATAAPSVVAVTAAPSTAAPPSAGSTAAPAPSPVPKKPIKPRLSGERLPTDPG
jgi:serine/threonine protein kinase